jgi:hypothetical protein
MTRDTSWVFRASSSRPRVGDLAVSYWERGITMIFSRR